MAFSLGPRSSAAGHRLASYDEIGSTNAEAMARGRSGDPGGLWVAARNQTSGRGRRGRPWATPSGNLAASYLTVTEVSPAMAATLGFVAGLALDDALSVTVPGLTSRMALDAAQGEGRARLALKWPNDVLADGAKLAGILLEAEPLDAARVAVVVGIGVNVVSAPAGTPYPATSLDALGASVTAEVLFEALSDAWAAFAARWDEGRGLPDIRRLWLARAAGIGQPVAVRVDGRVIRGTFETIDDGGRLVVRTEAGHTETIAAGEVHFGTVATAMEA